MERETNDTLSAEPSDLLRRADFLAIRTRPVWNQEHGTNLRAHVDGKPPFSVPWIGLNNLKVANDATWLDQESPSSPGHGPRRPTRHRSAAALTWIRVLGLESQVANSGLSKYHLQKLGRLLCAQLLMRMINLTFACEGSPELASSSHSGA